MIAKIVADTGVKPEVARKAAIVILKFLRSDGPADKVEALIAALPGATEAITASGAGGSSGLMGAFNDLTGAGVGMFKVKSVVESFADYARGKVGAETIDEIVASIPGLSQFA
ncbi:MAG: DUF2267 domain-containing protein [Bauldia sp.]|nr:DUF2267 domain-containing protein [Bauldia sp.]